MHFCLVDRILEQSADRIVTIKQVSAAEEYLQDHFPGFPVLPGVLMIEAMVQAGRILLQGRAGPDRLVLGAARGIKYGSFVRPGRLMRVEVSLRKEPIDHTYELDAVAHVLAPGEPAPADPPVAAAGRLTLRRLRV